MTDPHSDPEGIAQLIAKWRAKAAEMCPVITRSKLPRRGFPRQQHYDRVLGAVIATCADELEALLGRLPRGEGPTRFAWLMERHLTQDAGDLLNVRAGTLVYWDGGHAESFTTDPYKAVQWTSAADAKAQCPPEHYEQWGWRYVEHGFIGESLQPIEARGEGPRPEPQDQDFTRGGNQADSPHLQSSASTGEGDASAIAPEEQ